MVLFSGIVICECVHHEMLVFSGNFNFNFKVTFSSHSLLTFSFSRNHWQMLQGCLLNSKALWMGMGRSSLSFLYHILYTGKGFVLLKCPPFCFSLVLPFEGSIFELEQTRASITWQEMAPFSILGYSSTARSEIRCQGQGRGAQSELTFTHPTLEVWDHIW